MIGAIVDVHIPAIVFSHAFKPDVISVTRVCAIDHAEAILGMANDGEICANAGALVEEVCVNTLADGGIATDFGDASVFHQGFCIGAQNVVNGKMRQIDHADVVRHRQLLGIRYPAEVTVVPLMLAYRYFIAVFLQQVFVGSVTVRALPARQFHEVAAQFLLARPERAAAQVTALGIGFAVVHCGVIYLERGFVAAIVNIRWCFLNRVVACRVDTEEVHLGDAVGHPVHQHLGDSGGVLDPHRDGVPEPAGLRGFANRRSAIGSYLQQTVKRVFLVVTDFAQDRGQFHGAFQRFHDLIEFEITLRR